VLELLDRLCRYHHRLKTTNGWALVDGTGKRDFVPLEDPRHPRYAKARSVRGGTGATEDGPGGGPDKTRYSPGWSIIGAVGTKAGASREGRYP
jgi:hypothetical protein